MEYVRNEFMNKRDYQERLNSFLGFRDRKYRSKNLFYIEYVEDEAKVSKSTILESSSFIYAVLTDYYYSVSDLIKMIKSYNYTYIKEKYLNSISNRDASDYTRIRFYRIFLNPHITLDQLYNKQLAKLQNASNIEMIRKISSYNLKLFPYGLNEDGTAQKSVHREKLRNIAGEIIKQKFNLNSIQHIYLRCHEMITSYFPNREINYIDQILVQKSPSLGFFRMYIQDYIFELVKKQKEIPVEMYFVYFPKKITKIALNYLEEILVELDNEINEYNAVHDFSLLTKYFLLYKDSWQIDPKKMNEDDLDFLSVEVSYLELLRNAENTVREKYGFGKVGETWVEETKLYYLVKREYEYITEVKQHAHVKELGRQHLDIYIPEYRIAIEYQGDQHFKPVEYFGGLNAFERIKELDERKRQLCVENKIVLIYAFPNYDWETLKQNIESKINRKNA